MHGGPFDFRAAGAEVESAAGSGCDVQWPWEAHPGRIHSHAMNINAMYVDKYPTTNKQYHTYLQASGYIPRDRTRWLERNFDGGRPRVGWEDKPVTFVSLEDARSYCSFHRKRLPHAYEWQYFAQGTDGLPITNYIPKMAQQLNSRCGLLSDASPFGAWDNTRLES